MEPSIQWDLDLCLAHSKKVLVPFRYFVKPKSANLLPPPDTKAFPFFRLPVDLQLMIYEQCDAPTLFQLMRTCSLLRSPATRFFWLNASKDYWYYCHDSALFDYWPTDHLVRHHCPDFAKRITRLEINFTRLEFCFDVEDLDKTKARDFWAKLGRLFPAVQSVVLAGYQPRNSTPPAVGERDEDYTCIETVIDLSPSNIEVYVAFCELGGTTLRRHALWQVLDRPQPTWELLDSSWQPTCVLLPARKWPVSLLGDLSTFIWLRQDLRFELYGFDWLLLETYVRYAIDGTIHCPRLDCAATFPDRTLWDAHLRDAGHNLFDRYFSLRNSSLSLEYYEHTPDAEKTAMDARQKYILDRSQQQQSLELKIGYAWGPHGSEQRRLFEHELAAQLAEENLSVIGDLPQTIDDPLSSYRDILHVHFDRTHVYHGCSGPSEDHICYDYKDEA